MRDRLPYAETRDEALRLKLPHYYDGTTCSKGHLSVWDARTGGCVKCMKLLGVYEEPVIITTKPRGRRKKYATQEEAKAAQRQQMKRWYEKNKHKRKEKVLSPEEQQRRAECAQRWRANNKERIQAYKERQRREYDPEKAREKRLERAGWYKEYKKRYYQANKARVHFWTRGRMQKVRLATPPWVDQEAILAIYQERKRVSDETGITHEVDHIVPLRHPLVCGLHVPANLRVIPREENRRKNGKFHVYGT